MRIASSGMPCSIITPTKLCDTRRSAGDSACSTARSRIASCRGGQLDGALLQAADRLGDGEHARLRVAGGVAVHADAGDEADALLVAAAHLGAEHARRDQADVAGRIEPVERQRVAAGHDRPARPASGDSGTLGMASSGTRMQIDVRLGRRLDVLHREAVGLGRRLGCRRCARRRSRRAPSRAGSAPTSGPGSRSRRPRRACPSSTAEVRVAVVVDRRHR